MPGLTESTLMFYRLLIMYGGNDAKSKSKFINDIVNQKYMHGFCGA